MVFLGVAAGAAGVDGADGAVGASAVGAAGVSCAVVEDFVVFEVLGLRGFLVLFVLLSALFSVFFGSSGCLG